jgi:hypothetical protein
MKRLPPGAFRLTREERKIDEALLRGEYVPAPKKEHDRIKRMIARYRQKVWLRIRIRQGTLDGLKTQAKRRGVKYQTFIAEVLHRIAHN